MRDWLKFLFIGAVAISSIGCKSVNNRLGKDTTNYATAQELPPLKFPPRSIPVSNRYDIPSIPGDKEQVITEIVPPDF